MERKSQVNKIWLKRYSCYGILASQKWNSGQLCKNQIACETSKSLEAFGTLTKSAWLNNSILGIVNRNLQEILETLSILVHQ